MYQPPGQPAPWMAIRPLFHGLEPHHERHRDPGARLGHRDVSGQHGRAGKLPEGAAGSRHIEVVDARRHRAVGVERRAERAEPRRQVEVLRLADEGLLVRPRDDRAFDGIVGQLERAGRHSPTAAFDGQGVFPEREAGHQAEQRIGAFTRAERRRDVATVQRHDQRKLRIGVRIADLDEHVAAAHAVGVRGERPDPELGIGRGRVRDRGSERKRKRKRQHAGAVQIQRSHEVLLRYGFSTLLAARTLHLSVRRHPLKIILN